MADWSGTSQQLNRVNFQDYQLHYQFNGSPEHPVLLLLHGFMGSTKDFSEAISSLSQQFCCLAVDLPGHGKTKVIGGCNCYSMSNTARALIRLLDRLNIDKCFLIGYSMGGRLALYLMLEFPSRFAGVVLESASPGLKTQQARSQRRQLDEQRARELETGDFRAFLSNWYKQPLFQSLGDRPDFEQIIEQRLQNNPIELAKSLRYMGTGVQPSLWEKLPQNRIPLLLLVGKWDEKFRAINTEMEHLCPNAKLAIIPNSGHTIHIENAAEWVTQVKQFCTSCYYQLG